MKALDDVTVLDLSHALAGPTATTILADFGARVIKVEPPGSGDMARKWGPPFHGEDSAFFVTINRNKQSIEIDLKHPAGRKLFLDLARKADVVLENFRVGTVASLGIDYRRVRKVNPSIVYCSISGYGQDGPYRDRAAMDLIVQAESGMMSITGEEGRGPVRAGVAIGDLMAGVNAALAVLMALHARRRTGKGQFVDVSMLEGQLGLLDHLVGVHLADHLPLRPLGTAYNTVVPYQAFRTKTQDCVIAVASDALWKPFCRVLGAEELRDDVRYATNPVRKKNRVELVARLQEIFLTRTYRQWEKLFLEAGLPFGGINTLEQVIEHPQVKARGVLARVRHPKAGMVQFVSPIFKLTRTPAGAATPAPLLGQHTDQVLRQRLRLTAGAIAKLRRDGVLGRERAAAAPGRPAVTARRGRRAERAAR